MFASKYMLYLPTEEELRRELARECNQLRTRQQTLKSDSEKKTWR